MLSGFRKCGIYPFNPGQISDRQMAPANGVTPVQTLTPEEAGTPPDESAVSLFSPEEETLYKKRYEEGYDVNDPAYMAWLRINYPTSVTSASTASSSSKCLSSKTSSSTSIEDILVLPKPPAKSGGRKRKPALTQKAVCITDEGILDHLKQKEVDKQAAEEAKAQRKIERRKTEKAETRIGREEKTTGNETTAAKKRKRTKKMRIEDERKVLQKEAILPVSMKT